MAPTDISPTWHDEVERGRSGLRRRRWCRPAVGGTAALSLCLAAVGVAGSPAGAASGQLQKVTLATTSAGVMSAVLDTAVQKGIFKAQGLTVTVSKLTTNLAVDAVEAGKIDYETGAGVTPDSAALAGQPVKTYAALVQKETFVLVAAPGITKISQLKGTTVAGQSPTALNTVFLTQLLAKDGILPSVQVVHLNTGSSGAIALLEAGKASAAVIDYGAYLEMPSSYHVLYNYFASTSPFYSVTDGVVADPTYVATHQSQLRKLIVALVNAKNYFEKHEKAVVPIIAKAFSLTTAKAKTYWKKVADVAFTTKGKPTSAAIKFQASLDQATLNLSAPPPASKLYDWSYLPK